MFVRDPRTGQVVQVNPGMSNAQYRRMMSTLPDAELAGAVGPGVVPNQGARGVGAKPPPMTFRPLAGSPQNNRGSSVIITPPTLSLVNETFNLNETVFQTQQPTQDDAEVMALSLGAQPANAGVDPLVSSNIKTSMFCELTWGIGGTTFTAQLDWIRGVNIVVPASFVRVRAFYSGILLVAGAQTPPAMVFSGGAAYGYVGGGPTNQCRRTVDLGTIGGLASVDTPVPPFATSYTLVFDSSATPNITASQRASSTGGTASVAVHTFTSINANTSNQRESNVPVVDGAISLNVANSAIGGVGVRVVWGLSL